jgi:hypothetical protein
MTYVPADTMSPQLALASRTSFVGARADGALIATQAPGS